MIKLLKDQILISHGAAQARSGFNDQYSRANIVLDQIGAQGVDRLVRFGIWKKTVRQLVTKGEQGSA